MMIDHMQGFKYFLFLIIKDKQDVHVLWNCIQLAQKQQFDWDIFNLDAFNTLPYM